MFIAFDPPKTYTGTFSTLDLVDLHSHSSCSSAIRCGVMYRRKLTDIPVVTDFPVIYSSLPTLHHSVRDPVRHGIRSGIAGVCGRNVPHKDRSYDGTISQIHETLCGLRERGLERRLRMERRERYLLIKLSEYPLLPRHAK